MIVDELKGEKIDIVKYSEDDAEFITQALSPATVLSVTILPGPDKACRVVVPDNQLSLAIGNKGQNAKLAARLTGYKIDIRPESHPVDEEELAAEEAARQEEALAAAEDTDSLLTEAPDAEEVLVLDETAEEVALPEESAEDEEVLE